MTVTTPETNLVEMMDWLTRQGCRSIKYRLGVIDPLMEESASYANYRRKR
jgi:hypothetical protein